MATAPDPGALLDATWAAATPARAGAVPLSIVTWNVALLDTRATPPLPRFQSPFLAERRRRLPGLVFRRGFDVVLLQEVWRKEDLRRFIAAGEAHGYRVVHGPRDEYVDGLALFVRDALIDDARPESGAVTFEDQEPLEELLGPHIRRGYVWISFRARGLGRVRIYDTHLQSFASYWLPRLRQARAARWPIASAWRSRRPSSPAPTATGQLLPVFCFPSVSASRLCLP